MMDSNCHAGRFSCLLEPRHMQVLGCMNKHWFHDLSLKSCTSAHEGLNETPCLAAHDHPVVSPNDGLTTTSQEDDSTQPHNPMSTPLGVAMPLFSPAVPQGSLCSMEKSSHCRRVNSGQTQSPSKPGPFGKIPGLGCVTPGISSVNPGMEVFTPLSTLLHLHNTSYQEGSSVKRLFKTPSSVGGSTPRHQRITHLTGIDLDGTDVSWSESLATPSNANILRSGGPPDADIQKLDGSTNDFGNIGVARMLFSPQGAVPSQEEEILPLNNTIPEVMGNGTQAESAGICRDLINSGEMAHLQDGHDTEKTNMCDVTEMKKQGKHAVDTSDIVTPTVTRNDRSEFKGHQMEHTETCHSVDVTDLKEIPRNTCQSDPDTHSVMTDLPSNREDEREEYFTSPSQPVSVMEALSIFDTPPSCATLKKKSVPRRSRRHHKVTPCASPNDMRLDDETLQLLLDNDVDGISRCVCEMKQEASKHDVEVTDSQVKTLGSLDENPLKSDVLSKDILVVGRQPVSENEQPKLKTIRTNGNDEDVCQSMPKFCNKSNPSITDEMVTKRCLEVVHHNDTGVIGSLENERAQETPFKTSTKNKTMLPLSKPGGDDGFSQISQATLSAACAVVDHLSDVCDHCGRTHSLEGTTSLLCTTHGMNSQVCKTRENKNCCGEVGDSKTSEDRHLCYVDKMCEDKHKICSACGCSATTELSPIVEAVCHMKETVKCVVCSASNVVHSASGETLCSACSQVCYDCGSKVCSEKNESCTVDSSTMSSSSRVQCGGMNAAASNLCCGAKTQYVNTGLKSKNRPTVRQLKYNDGDESDRAIMNEDISFTQISPSTIDAILHISKPSRDPPSATTNIDANPSADLFCFDWSKYKSHKSSVTPNKMTKKHASSDELRELEKCVHGRVHEKILSKLSPTNCRVANDGCLVGGSHVAKQPGLNTDTSKILSLRNRRRMKFSYPSIRQISSMCPQRVFNLKTDTFSVINIVPGNSVEPVDEKPSGKTDLSGDSVPVNAMDCDKGLVRFDRKENIAEDLAQSMTLARDEGVKDKKNDRTNPSCPNITGISTGFQLETAAKKYAGRCLLQNQNAEPSTSAICSESIQRAYFSGFATASNKEVLFSKAALEAALKLVAECDTDDSSNSHCHSHTNTKLLPSFKMQRVNFANTKQKKQNACQTGNATPSGTQTIDCVGFKITSATPIQVSESALKKVHCDGSFPNDTTKIFDVKQSCLDCESACHVIADTNAQIKQNLVEDHTVSSHAVLSISSLGKSAVIKNVKNIGFHTASNKQIKVSNSALAVAQKLVEMDDNVCRDDVNSHMKHDKDVSNRNTGRVDHRDTMALGSIVSSVALNTGSAVEIVTQEGDFGQETTMIPEGVAAEDLGFQYASGERISVREESIEKAVKPLDCVSKETSLLTNNRDESPQSRHSTKATPTYRSAEMEDFAGFRSASGKDILLKEESIKKATELVGTGDMGNCISYVVEEYNKSKFVGLSRKEDTRGKVFVGFQCASEKEVHLTEPSLERAKSLIKIIDKETIHEGDYENIGFQPCTATGKDCVDLKEDTLVNVTRCGGKAAVAGANDISFTAKKLHQYIPHAIELNHCTASEINDYSHLPKDFRPFKAPRMVANKRCMHQNNLCGLPDCSLTQTDTVKTNSEIAKERQNAVRLEKSTYERNDPKEQVMKLCDIPENSHEMKETKADFPKEHLSASSHGFDDEGFEDLTYTQISEITDLTVMCLQHQHEFDESSFVQVASPVKEQQAKVERRILGVITEKLVSRRGGRESPLCTEGDRKEGGKIGRKDPVTQEGISGVDSDIVESSVGRNAPLSGKQAGVRCKVAGRLENLLADISQLSEWEVDRADSPLSEPGFVCGFDMAVGDAAVNCCSNRSDSDVQTTGELVSSLDPRSITGTHKSKSPEEGQESVKHLTTATNRQFQGFRTATGKKVAILESALKETRRMFSSNIVICKESQLTEDLPSLLKQSFKTASDKVFPISEMTLVESKKIFDDEIYSITSKQIKPFNPRRTNDAGFMTARGNKLFVSEKAMEESNKNFLASEIGCNNSVGKDVLIPGGSENKQDENFTGFTTARGNKVSVSGKALLESRKLFEDNVKSSRNVEQKDVPADVQQLNADAESVIGFVTARDNKVFVCEEALKESTKIFNNNDSSASRNLESKKTTLLEQSPNTIATHFTGFATAKGNKVSVSEKALKESKKMFMECDENRFPGACNPVQSTHENAESDTCRLARTKTPASPYTDVGSILTRSDGTICNKETENISTKEKLKRINNNSSDEHFTERQFINKMDVKENDIDGGYAVTEQDKPNSHARRWQHRTSTPAFGDNDRRRMTASFGEDGQTRSVKHLPRWLSPITSSPDECLRDRASGSRLVALRSVHTTLSENDEGNPRRMLCSVGTPQKNVTPQRPSFMGHNKTHSSHQPLPLTAGRDTFAPPFKKSDCAHSTPHKLDTQSSFKTPIKLSGGPDHLRKRLAFADKPSAQLEKKLKLDVGVGFRYNKYNQTEHPEEDVELDSSVRELDAGLANKLENVGKVIGSSCQQNHSEKNTNLSLKISVGKDIHWQQEMAHRAQLTRITEKQHTQTVKPIPGKLFTLKLISQQVSLKDAVHGATPGGHTVQQLYSGGVKSSTLHVTATNAEEFRFKAHDYFASKNLDEVHVGDGAFLIFNPDGTAGKVEFCNAFLDMPGVEPALVSQQWVFNHYRWIVWKLAAMEVAFPQCFAARSLTADQMMLQLKYRYDREVDRSHRSALKKIYERDDVAQKTMVLCVSAVRCQPSPAELATSHRNTGQKGEGKKDTNMSWLELTDGWYPIRACLDAPLTRLVARHKIRVGDKLCICRAELVGPTEGAPPLQGVEETSLKLSANSTRIARWDAKLGYASHPRPMVVPLGSLIPDGGLVGGLDVTVTRVYPLQFMEKLADGSNVFRSVRAEEKETQKFEQQRQRILEDAYGKIQMEFEHRSQLHMGSKKLDDQEEALHTEFQQRISELQQDLPVRNVVSLLKVRLAGVTPADIDSRASAVLSIWRPAPEVLDKLTEGCRFKIYNLVTSEARGRQSTIALSATRTTQYLSVSVDDNLLDLIYEPREVLSFDEMREDIKPPYGEVDVAGIVVWVSDVTTFDRPGNTEGCVQTVYLADCGEQMIAVKFWRMMTTYGLKELLTVGTVVAATNLQWRYDSRNKLPTITANELSVFSVKPRQAHLKAAIHKLQAHLKITENFVATHQSHLQGIISGLSAPVTPQSSAVDTVRYKSEHSFTISTPNSSTKNSLCRLSTTRDHSQTTTKRTVCTPCSNSPRLISGDFPLTSGGCCNDVLVEDENPRVARQRAVQRAKAWRLESYGNPLQHMSPLPSLIPIALRKAFKSPLVCPRVSTPMKDSSSLDRTLKVNHPSLIDSRQRHAGNDFPESSCVVDVKCCDTESQVNIGVEVGHGDPHNTKAKGTIKGTQDQVSMGVVSKVKVSDFSSNKVHYKQGKKNKCAPSLLNDEKPLLPVRRKSLRSSKQYSAD